MDADPEDPEPAAPAHRAFFYGLWPRFTSGDGDRADADPDAAPGPAADVWRGGVARSI